MNNHKPILTNDGSHTIYSDMFGAYYHSLNGAVTESIHVYINAGFIYAARLKSRVSVLEVGFGTGLNAALTAWESEGRMVGVQYTAVELYPLSDSERTTLNYGKVLKPPVAELWKLIVMAPWENFVPVNRHFNLCKINADFTGWVPGSGFDLIYFDAFAPEDQPEMWTSEIFGRLYESLNTGGILVTYSSKGIVKQALRNSGFKVERLPGPPGKRHITRAIKA